MTASFTIAPLGASYIRREFLCGVPALDRYFHEFVSQDIKRRISNCFVALDHAGTIAGYYTLAATSLPLIDLPADDTKKLPRYPLLPACFIGRLAIDQRYRRQGLGCALIVDAVARAIRCEPAIFALVVDAKDESAAKFYQHLGFRPLASQPMKLFITLAEAARRLAQSGTNT